MCSLSSFDKYIIEKFSGKKRGRFKKMDKNFVQKNVQK